jgi:membrane protein DedA with SNARE-associated domain
MNFIEIVSTLAKQAKYPALFLIYLIEGPIAGFISSFVANTGALNIYTVFILFIIAEIGADIFYFYIGKKLSQKRFDKKLSSYEKKGFISVLKNVFNSHPVKALIFVKVVGVIAIPSLLFMGRYKSMTWGKFLFWTSIICLIKDLLITLMGYSLGVSLSDFLVVYDIYKIVALILSILGILSILLIANRGKIEEKSISFMKKIK